MTLHDSSPGCVRLLLVDPHAMVRDGLRRILAEAFPDLRCGDAATTTEALLALRAARWDAVLLDLSVAGRGGLDLLKDIRRLRPRLPVLVTTPYADDPFAVRCFRAGAAGYVAKARPATELVEATRRILAGGRYLDADLAEQLAASLVWGSDRPAHDALSDRELQVLQLLARGRSVRDIAAELHLSDKTISTYRARILEKLQLRSSGELVRYAIRSELVD